MLNKISDSDSDSEIRTKLYGAFNSITYKILP